MERDLYFVLFYVLTTVDNNFTDKCYKHDQNKRKNISQI